MLVAQRVLPSLRLVLHHNNMYLNGKMAEDQHSPLSTCAYSACISSCGREVLYQSQRTSYPFESVVLPYLGAGVRFSAACLSHIPVMRSIFKLHHDRRWFGASSVCRQRSKDRSYAFWPLRIYRSTERSQLPQSGGIQVQRMRA